MTLRRRVLVIEWFVDLRALGYVDPERKARMSNDNNELCFVLDSGYYVRPVRTLTFRRVGGHGQMLFVIHV